MLTRLVTFACLALLAIGVIALAKGHWLALAYVTAACACWLFIMHLARKG